jgi:membrane associated rhomboid family serine protease
MVMPLYDDNPFKATVRPVVTWSLVVANILIFAFELVAAPANTQLAVNAFGMTPSLLSGELALPQTPLPSVTLFSYMFLHADIVHLIGNLLFLWVYGDDVERALGRFRFLVFYLTCGIVGGLFFFLSDIRGQVPLIGASGAIAGVVIAYVMLRPCAKITVLAFGIPMRISAYWVIGAFIALQFINLGSASKSEVAYWCHIGGMLAGGLLFPFMRQPGVELFECIEPAPRVTVAMPDASQLPGAPQPDALR